MAHWKPWEWPKLGVRSGCLFFAKTQAAAEFCLKGGQRSPARLPGNDILMNRSSLLPAVASLLLIAGLACPATSQERRAERLVEKPSEKSSRSYQKSTEIKPKSIARQKAEYRGMQRTARLESLRRQGISIARPTVYGLPFTNTYRPQRRCYYGGRPIIIINRN